MDKKGGGREYHDFLSKNFCLTASKNFAGQPFSVSLISGIEKLYASEGYVTILRRKIFVSVPKHFVEELFCAVFRKISGSEKFMDKREGEVSRFSFESFLCHSAEKFR